MSNSLGSLGSFQVQPEQPGQLTGMRYALNVPPAAGPKVGPQPPVEGAEKKTAPPAPVRRSAEQIAELIGDCDKAVSRLEKAAARGQSVPELIAQLKGELLNQLVAEALALEPERAKAPATSWFKSSPFSCAINSGTDWPRAAAFSNRLTALSQSPISSAICSADRRTGAGGAVFFSAPSTGGCGPTLGPAAGGTFSA